MFDQVNKAIDEYMVKWNKLVAGRKNKEFFERLKLTAVGWKTTDLVEYDRLFNTWREECDQIHFARLNDRFIAAMHLRGGPINRGIELIKLMQRRPNSTDAVGLDHLDFMDMEQTNTKAVLAEEKDLKWTEEENGMCRWISVWFDGTEAKLRGETVFDVAVAELEAVNSKIRGPKFALPQDENSGTSSAEVE
jgi:hypothetical protein